jgi:cytochrome c-type biogenesis protein CcmH/NrfG
MCSLVWGYELQYRVGLVGIALLSLMATPAIAAPKYFEDCVAAESTTYLRIESCTFSLQADTLDDKQRVEVLLNRAKGYAAQFWPENASADLAEAKRLAPDDPAVTAAFADLSHFIGGRDDVAIAAYKEILQKNGDDPKTLMKLAMSYVTNRDFARARPVFDKVLELEPDNVDALSWRSTYYTQDKQYDLALADLERAVAADPMDIRARSYRAQALLYAGTFDRAIEDLNFIVKAQPAQPIYRFRGIAAYLTGALPAAEADFLHDLDVDPVFANLAAWRSFVEQRRGGDGHAELLRIVIALDGRWPAALLNVPLGQATIAEAMAGAAAAPSPELRRLRESQAHAVIGEWLLLSGDKTGAVEQFQAVQDIGLVMANEEMNGARAFIPSDTVVEFTLARARLKELRP